MAPNWLETTRSTARSALSPDRLTRSLALELMLLAPKYDPMFDATALPLFNWLRPCHAPPAPAAPKHAARGPLPRVQPMWSSLRLNEFSGNGPLPTASWTTNAPESTHTRCRPLLCVNGPSKLRKSCNGPSFRMTLITLRPNVSVKGAGWNPCAAPWTCPRAQSGAPIRGGARRRLVPQMALGDAWRG